MDNVGESVINPQVQQQVAPDVVSPQGKQQLFNKLATATVNKKGLDQIFGAIANKYGGTFSSRVKSPQTVVQKIAQKRIQGRDYNTSDVNDLYGARLITEKKNFPKIIKDIEKVSSVLGFDINKNEDASHGTYKGWHIDMQDPQGGKFEIQLHTPQSEAEAVVNHSLRSQYGEEPDNPAVEQLRNKQAAIVNQLPDQKARAISEGVKQLGKQNGGQPIDPRVIASTLAQQQQSM